MDNLKTITELVKDVLLEVSETRNSDDLLYYHVCKRLNPICVDYPFQKILQNRKDYGIPSFKSVERARRKVQRSNPDLVANDKVEGFRSVKEVEYRDYARKVSV